MCLWSFSSKYPIDFFLFIFLTAYFGASLTMHRYIGCGPFNSRAPPPPELALALNSINTVYTANITLKMDLYKMFVMHAACMLRVMWVLYLFGCITFDSEWVWGYAAWLKLTLHTVGEIYKEWSCVYALYRLQVFKNENSDSSLVSVNTVRNDGNFNQH